MKTTLLQNHIVHESLTKEISTMMTRLITYSDYYVSMEIKSDSIYLYVSANNNTLLSRYILLKSETAGSDLTECLNSLNDYWEEVLENYAQLVSFYSLPEVKAA